MSDESARMPWPPKAHVPRLARYARNERLYLGEHEDVFVQSGEYKYTYDERREYITDNLLGALSDLLASRTVGEPVTIGCPEGMEGTEAWFRELDRHSAMERLNIEQVMGASYRGDALYKVRYDAGSRRVVIDAVSPEIWYPEVDPLNQRRVIAHTLAQVLGSGTERFLWFERHELRGGAGWITNRLFRLRGDVAAGTAGFDPAKDAVPLTALKATGGLPEEQATGIDALLLVHVGNRSGTSRSVYGISDYDGLISIQGEINNRMTQRAEVLDKFVDPLVYGPELEDENGDVVLRDNKYLTMPDNGTAPAGYLVWDAQLPAVKDHLAELRQDFAAIAGVDLQALRPGEGAGPASGRALKLLQMRTQDKAKSKAREFGPALQQVYSVASKLAAALPAGALDWDGEPIEALNPDDIVVQFSDGLPNVQMEAIEEQTMMVDAGLQSTTRALQELHGLDRASAKALAAEIKDDKGAARPAPASPIGTGLGAVVRQAAMAEGIEEQDRVELGN